MDLSLTDDQRSVAELAEQIFTNQSNDERLREFYHQPADYDADLWKSLTDSGLHAACIEEQFGGSAMGFTELCLVIEQQGRFLSPIPLIESVVLAALPLQRFGDDAQKARLLPALAGGEVVLSGSIPSKLAPMYGEAPLRYRETPDGYRLSGFSGFVPNANSASEVLISGIDESGDVAFFLVSPEASGVNVHSQSSTSYQTLCVLECTDVSAERLGARIDGSVIEKWIEDRITVAFAVMQLGVVQSAVSRTAQYTLEREQFGRPIASFQAVAHQAANAYIDCELFRSICWQAVTCLDAGMIADKEVLTASWWACRVGHQVGHTTQHLHGGIGADLDYPIHRYFLNAKHISFLLGGGSRDVAELGELLIADDKPLI